MEKIQMLEEKITRVIEKIKVLTEENDTLNSKIGKLQDGLADKDEEIAALKQALKSAQMLKGDIEKR